MQHHARQRLAGSLLAMRPASGSPGHMSRGLQGLLRPAIGPRPAVLGLPAFVEVLDGPARVPGRIPRHHAQRLIDRHRAGREPTDPPILQPLDPFGVIAPTPAAKRPFRHAQHLRRLRHRECPPLSPLIQLFESHLSHLL